jgi:hypothetical protein
MMTLTHVAFTVSVSDNSICRKVAHSTFCLCNSEKKC